MRTLVAQREWPADDLGRSLGLEMFETATGDYQAVIHNRTYDGIKVASSFRTPPIDLIATGKVDAWREALGRAVQWWHDANGHSSKLKENA